jgi:hypothetical protein
MQIGKLTLAFLLAAVVFAAVIIINPWEKREAKIMAQERERTVVTMDLENDKPFETATFSLG